MKTRTSNRSLRIRISWLLALQSFLGLGLVCLAVYLVTLLNFRERQENALSQKESVIRHVLTEDSDQQNSENKAHKFDDFFVGSEIFSVEISNPDGHILYTHNRNQSKKSIPRKRNFEVTQIKGGVPNIVRIKLSLDTQSENELLNRIGWTLFIAALAGAIIVSLSGFWLVKYGLAPLKRLTGQASLLSADSLHQRLDGKGQPLELHPLVDQFNALLTRIEKAYLQMEGFNADVAHELYTPLATLMVSNELALTQIGETNVRDVLGSNLEELHRLTGIVKDMLFLSQADRGVGARRSHVGSLATVANEVLEYHEAAMAEAELNAAVIGEAQGNFDVPLLRRAISNLLGNATRYATPGTYVQLVIQPMSEDQVHFYVVNQGDTISSEDLPHLFDRFFRGDPARTHGQVNHGLGLAIVGAIARMHQGSPTVSSSDGVTRIGLKILSKDGV